MEKFVSVKEFQIAALEKLKKDAGDYYRTGSGSEFTLRENQASFSRLRIMPKCLRDVSNVDMSTKILNHKINWPLGIAPTAMQKLAHPHGEIASAKMAAEQGTIFILSTLSTTSIEDVAENVPEGIKWFQLYIFTNRNITKHLVERAEKAGFQAIVVTVDTPVFGLRRENMRNTFNIPPPLKFVNFESFLSAELSENKSNMQLNDYINTFFDSSLSWSDIKWLQSITKLPIILKGILRSDDAYLAAKCGVAAIIVSNHGARQLDSTPATIEALPEIVKAVKGFQTEIYLDGGVSEGNDIFKAIALGAKMVFIGRPVLWGLANDGENGVRQVMNILKTEFKNTMALAGCANISKITPDLVVHQSSFSKL